MIKDKVLIFHTGIIDINKGGPAGFLAHNLVDKPRNIFVLSQDLIKKEIIKDIPYRLKRALYYIKLYRKHVYLKKNYYKEFFYNKLYFDSIEAHKYKFLYFHSSIDFEFCKDLISPEQIVLFQPHTPECAYEEYKKMNPSDIDRVKLIKASENNVFNRADIIILPNESCIELYSEFLSKKRKRFEFIISGAKSKYNLEECLIDNNLELDNNKINLMYIGRRNEIKGFDIVLESFRKARQIRKDINLIIIGSGDKIKEEGIIDIGFTKNPIYWYGTVDYLINANRKSYFDLSIMEALSTGVPIIMSNNYGHKYFSDKTKLIKSFDVNENDSLYKILIGDLAKRNKEENDNILFYEDNLTDIRYFERFEKTIKKILNEYI